MVSQKDPSLYLLVIRWESAEAHLESFRKSAAFREFFTHIRGYVDDILEMEHYADCGLNWTR